MMCWACHESEGSIMYNDRWLCAFCARSVRSIERIKEIMT